MFSGGAGSWAAARRTVAKYGAANVVLLFADTRIEDADLYRFLDDAAADIGADLVRIQDGRTPWDVFEDRRMLGNSRIAPCSTELKQRPARSWMETNAPFNAVVVLGIDWTEMHRLPGARKGWEPWSVEAPMCERPWLSKPDILESMGAAGLQPPRLYAEGFPHNNCGGGCVRAGQAHFAHLLRQRPDTFTEWETGERRLQEYLGRNVTILRDRKNGESNPLSLSDLRQRLAQQPELFSSDEWGGCGCFVDGEA